MIEIFSYVLSLVLLKAFFILFGIVVVIKRSEPFVKFGIKLIFVCVVRIVEYFIMPSVLKSYEGKTWVILVFLIILIVSIFNTYHIIICTM